MRSIRYKITDTSLLKKVNYDEKGLSEYHREINNYCIETWNQLARHFDNNLKIDIKGESYIFT